MGNRNYSILLLSSAISLAFLHLGITVNGSSRNKSHEQFNGASYQPKQFFVFGDSYADTGNLGKLGREFTHSWYYPYGITFPKRPTGRFSDGRLLTDFLASFLGIRSPIPYKYRRVGYKLLPYGMNFAVGGAGVFDTGNFQRNISAQIDLFEDQIKRGVFDKCELKTSAVALFAVSGNDYSYIAERENSTDAAADYIPKVVKQIKRDVKRLCKLGLRKVMITNMHPLGCTPLFARGLNYTDCHIKANLGSWNHNQALGAMIYRLDPSNRIFLTLNLHETFQNIIYQVKGAKKFKSPNRPCCESFGSDGYCGQIDGKGNNEFTLCSNPEEYFYWDDAHPTQAGWAAVFESLKDPIRRFLYP